MKKGRLTIVLIFILAFTAKAPIVMAESKVSHGTKAGAGFTTAAEELRDFVGGLKGVIAGKKNQQGVKKMIFLPASKLDS